MPRTVFCKVAKQEFPAFLSKTKEPDKFRTDKAKNILCNVDFGNDKSEDELQDNTGDHQSPIDGPPVAGKKIGQAYNEQQTGGGPEIIHSAPLDATLVSFA